MREGEERWPANPYSLPPFPLTSKVGRLGVGFNRTLGGGKSRGGPNWLPATDALGRLCHWLPIPLLPAAFASCVMGKPAGGFGGGSSSSSEREWTFLYHPMLPPPIVHSPPPPAFCCVSHVTIRGGGDGNAGQPLFCCSLASGVLAGKGRNKNLS